MASAPSSVHPVRRSPLLVAGVVAAIALALAAVALLLVSRDDAEPARVLQGSGVAVTDTRDVDAFGAVELEGVNNVTIGVGGDQLVVVRADDNLIERVTTEVRGDTLVIGEIGSFDAVTPMSVEVTVPSLDEVRLSGTGTITVDGHALTDLTIAMPGAGTVRGRGSVTALEIDLGGTGDAEFGALVAKDATVVLSGSGSVAVHVTSTLDAEVSGAGSVTYVGDPQRVDKEVTGTGTVTGR